MGRCVYTGIYEPGHPTADEDGFRGDVLDLIRELGVTVVRYPGGNFVSSYRLGGRRRPRGTDRPTAARPRLARDRAQRRRRRRVHGLGRERPALEPMMAVNLGTRGVQEAVDLLEYCNHPGGTVLVRPAPVARRRGAARHQAVVPRQRDRRPLADGPEDRARVRPARRRDRQGDADGRRRASSWSPSAAPTRGCRPSARGSATVLEHTYDQVDYISLHAYYEQPTATTGQLPGLRRRTWTRSSTRWSPPPTTCGAEAAQPQEAQALVRRVERLVPGSASPASAASTGRSRPELIEDELHVARRRRRRQPPDHAAPARRPGRRRLPGPAGQRHRPDPHRARRPGLAADDLPPVRADRPATPAGTVLRRRADADRGRRPPRTARSRPLRRDRDLRRGDRRARSLLRGQPRAAPTRCRSRSTCAAVRAAR